MAGLQYYFFPTDFFYPRPPSSSAHNANGGDSRKTKSPFVSAETLKGDISEEDHYKAQRMHENKIPQASVSTSLDLSPFKSKAHKEMNSESIGNLAQQYWNFSG